MRKVSLIVVLSLLLVLAVGPFTASAQEGKWCEGVDIVFFPGGSPGGPFATVVYNGALAAEARGPDQPLVPGEHLRAGIRRGSPHRDPRPDPVRRVDIPLPLPEPLRGQRRAPRHGPKTRARRKRSGEPRRLWDRPTNDQ